VIHRDLKPSNIMVGAFGEVQVMDWGLAKVLGRERGLAPAPGRPPAKAPSAIRTARSEGSGPLSLRGTVLGTPAYMAPEQAAGEAERLDQRCDVFGLGAILCEVLTGQPPYVGEDDLQVYFKAAGASLAEPFARLDSCGAAPELVRLAKGSLAAEPADRPRDAGVLAAELAAHRESLAARLRQAELAQVEARARAEEERKRRRVLAALAGSVVLLLLLVVGTWLWVALERAKGERQAREHQAKLAREAEEALGQATTLRAQARAEGAPGKWAEARAQARRAETLLEQGLGRPVLAEQVRALLRQLEEEEADHRKPAQLEQVRLGRAHAGRREWEKAVACYDRALKLAPTDEGHFWFEYAAVLLLSGDRAGYRQACAGMVRRCGQAPQLRAYHVARACTLGPGSVPGPARPGQLAEAELRANAESFWSLTQLGALRYRAGAFEEAVPLFERSLRADGKPGRAVVNWLWLALAEQRRGKTEEARRWLDKAAKWLDQHPAGLQASAEGILHVPLRAGAKDQQDAGLPASAEATLGLHLHNWLEAHVLRREAEASLGPRPAAQ
jgi:tetratricopeptide (TPR) repeat protein